MKSFLTTNSRSDAEPLLSTANKASSSDELVLDDDDDDVVSMDARNRGGGRTIMTTLLSPFHLVSKPSTTTSCSQVSPTHTTSSTAHVSPDNGELSPPLSPQHQQQHHSPNGKFKGQIIISKQQKEREHGRRFASYRQNNNHHSPMSITSKKKRVGNTSLPASRSSPLLALHKNTFRNVRVNETFKSDNDTSDDTKLENERKLVVLQQETQLHGSPITSSKTKNELFKKEKITLIDLDDEVSCDSSCAFPTTDEEISPPRKRGGRNSRGHHSAPNRLDSERLLSQMGMNVSEEDYCIEGEFEKHRSRCHSYDCNYKQPLDDAYEDFGIERRLVVLNPPGHAKKQQRNQRGSKLAISSLDDACDRSHEEISGNSNEKDSHPAKDKILSRIVSILRVGGGSTSSRRNRKGNGNGSIPEQIVAPITPTSSDDDIDYPLTPEENCLFFKWQTARMRSANESRGDQPVPKKKNCEDVMSISASSCGDKTAPMDNRRRHHRQGFSF